MLSDIFCLLCCSMPGSNCVIYMDLVILDLIIYIRIQGINHLYQIIPDYRTQIDQDYRSTGGDIP